MHDAMAAVEQRYRISAIAPWPSEGHQLVATDVLAYALVGQETDLPAFAQLIATHGGTVVDAPRTGTMGLEPVVVLLHGHHYDVSLEPLDATLRPSRTLDGVRGRQASPVTSSEADR
jgi:hypothetical protein